ncbi:MULTISPECIES: GspE/PulE family protein [unclassified Nitratiruptor]|uniref:GspE/PulE family protein n=1 Tax=unclassified Nitratiruptor TaxID=2624044 RepID=UPI001915FF3A|nr:MULTISPECIES: GspE/PulE family protein [unclassified Nitratiruptor]BCD60275.1 general secretion pathway protein E [Nitratiruptor sp. YY08-10]BCD64236.1 general secretion pathway protein E [Nitratiruptor sp. YY08-14]
MGKERLIDFLQKHFRLNFDKNRNSVSTIINYLIEQGHLTQAQIVQEIAKALRLGKLEIQDITSLPSNLLTKVLQTYAKILNIEYIDMDSYPIDIKLISKIPLNILKKYNFLPVKETDLNVIVAVSDPLDIGAQEQAQRLFPKKPIKIALTSAQQLEYFLNKLELNENIREYINEIRKDLQSGGTNKEDLQESSAILKLIEAIIKTAVLSRASDIHIEPTEHNCIVRNRIDGILTEKFIFDRDIYPPLSSRLKLLANLDIAEKRKPQDGRFSAQILGKEYDFRVSTLPIITGESIVMRILDKQKAMIPLEEAGMSRKNFEIFTKALKTPYGIILVTGPTGSGKSTTLYGALNMIRSVEKKIITVEDPVEYQINMVQQAQVNPKIGFTFAAALRSILRQDPDIVMIGEIRDEETLRIATQAALTGHLVLSTLHTNDAISSINRMIDMGIEPYLVSGALIAIEAQRLVRRICQYCKTEIEIEPNVLAEIKEYLPKQYKFYKGKGCKHCDFTGYSGREMICEILKVDDEIARLIAKEAPKEKIEETVIAKGFQTMFEDGIMKALEGSTTIDEVFRVTRLQ